MQQLMSFPRDDGCGMLPPMSTFHGPDALLDRLTRRGASRRHAFLFGSALTAPESPGSPGVLGVSGVVELVEEHYRCNYPHALDKLREHLANAPNAYQAAFEHLAGRGNTDDANAIIRRAVLAAYQGADAGPDPRDRTICERAEQNLEAWYLPSWLKAAGELLATSPAQFADVVLTTNFDPLIQVAIERSGGRARTSVLDQDGNIAQNHGSGSHVIHLHGHWTATDTLHTQVQLSQPRPRLQESLQRLLEDKAVVVLGYGGWDDVFSKALSEVLGSYDGRIELLWAFYDSDEESIRSQNQELLERLKRGQARNQVTLYRGVNLRMLLPQLRTRLLTSAAGEASRSDARGGALAIGVGPAAPAQQQDSSVSPAVRTIPAIEIEANYSCPGGAVSNVYPPSDWSTFTLLRHPGENFVGRDREVRSLKEGLLGTSMRIGIVTGPGGIGKSSLLYRLWVECHAQFRSSFMIDCAKGPSPVELLAQLSGWLQSCDNPALELAMRNEGLSLAEKIPVSVKALEQGGPYLLALDNFESMLKTGHSVPAPKDEAIASLLACLARGLQNSKLLITSRVRFALDSPAGTVVSVPLFDLSLPEAASLMQRLPNLGRAGSDADYAALWQSGVRSPRLIDLAEAQLQDYELGEVRASIESRLHGPLIAEQQLNRIYAKLPQNAQALLRRASVYGEPVFYEGLQVHLQDVPKASHDPVKALLDRSLLNAVDAKIDDTMRKLYRMHETTRQWAEQKLREVEGQAGVAQAQRRGGYAFLRQLGNVPILLALQAGVAAWELLTKVGDLVAAGKLALAMAGSLQRRVHLDSARSMLEESLRNVEEKAPYWDIEARCHGQLGIIDCRQNRYEAAKSHFNKCLGLSRSHNDRLLEAASLCGLANVERTQGRLDQSWKFAREGFELSRALGEPRSLACCLCTMALVEKARINILEAVQYFVQALDRIVGCMNFSEESLIKKNFRQDEVGADNEILRDALRVLQVLDDHSSFLDIVGQLSELILVTVAFSQSTKGREELLTKLREAFGKLLSFASHVDPAVHSHLLVLAALMEGQGGTGGGVKPLLQKSIEMSAGLGDLSSVVAKIAMLAAQEDDLAQYEAAHLHYGEYLTIAEQSPGPPKALNIFLRGRLARVEGILERHCVAREHYLQALGECASCADAAEFVTAIRAGLLDGLSALERKLGNSDVAQTRQDERTQIIEDRARSEEEQGNHAAARRLRELIVKNTDRSPLA